MTRSTLLLSPLLLVAGACGLASGGGSGAALRVSGGEGTPPAAAAAEPSQRTLDVGDRLPSELIRDLAGTPAASVSELYGRAILLEFFAYWCVPCARAVPLANELHEKFSPRGLSIVGVTSESALKTEPWITGKGVHYAHAYDPSGELHRLFQVKSIPFSVLVDPFGTVLWSGQPVDLTEERVENALADALPTPVWQWPDATRALAAPLMQGKYAAALEQARGMPASEGFDPTALVQARIEALAKTFDARLQRKEYTLALNLGMRLERELAGLPEGERVAAAVARLRTDPAISKEVDDVARMNAFEDRAAAVRKVSEARKLRDELSAFLETGLAPKVETRAKALFGLIQRQLEKFGK